MTYTLGRLVDVLRNSLSHCFIFVTLQKKEIEGLIPAICFFVTRCLQILQTATFTEERTQGKV